MKNLLLALCAVVPLLSGCGSGGSTSTSDEAALKAKLDKPLGSPTGPSSGPKPANPHAPVGGGPPASTGG